MAAQEADITSEKSTLSLPSESTSKRGRAAASIISTISGSSAKKSTSRASKIFSSKESLDDVGADYPMLDLCNDEENHCNEGRLPLRRMLLFGLPFMGWYAVVYMKKTTMKPFYTDDYPKASLGYIAFFTTLGVLIDAFTDPAMANWTDNARPQCWGRRRPFVLLGSIIAVIIFTLSYTPVVPPGLAASIWFGIFHIGTKLADTALMIPLDAWGAEMTPNVTERSTLWMWREVFLVLGILFGAVLPSFLGEFGGLNCTETPDTGCSGYPMLAFVFGLLCLIGCTLLVARGKERPNERLPPPPQKGTWNADSVVPTLISTWLNRPFRCLIVSDVAEAFGGNLPFVVLPYFTRVVLGDACMKPSLMFSLLAGVNLISRILVLPVWVWAGKRFGKFPTYLTFNFMLAATHCLFFLVQRDTESCGQMNLTIATTVLWGVVYSGSFFLKSIMSDVADYDEFLTGKRREGQYMMTLEFLPKFLEVPAEALPFLLMAYLGYVRPSGDGSIPLQPQGVVWLIRLCVSVVPAAFILAGAMVLCSYPKEARSAEAHEALIVAIREKHRKGLPAEDPWYPGRVVEPPPVPGSHDNLLAHFWPAEIKAALASETESADSAVLQRRALRGVVIGVLLLPLGVVLMAVGWADMGSDLGASVSPIGLIFVGLAVLLIWFDGTRFLAAREIRQLSISRSELVARYNFLCRFTGESALHEARQQITNAAA